MNKKNIFNVFYLVIFIFLYSCSNDLEKKITKKWSVSKMEKIVSVTSNSYTPININIHPKMSYNFLPDYKAKLITQTGSSINGFWNVKDSIISITVKKERRKFKIIKIAENELILTSDKFKFHLKN